MHYVGGSNLCTPSPAPPACLPDTPTGRGNPEPKWSWPLRSSPLSTHPLRQAYPLIASARLLLGCRFLPEQGLSAPVGCAPSSARLARSQGLTTLFCAFTRAPMVSVPAPMVPLSYSFTCLSSIFQTFIPIKERSIHIFTRRQHQMLRITKICRNTTPSLTNLETRQDSGAGKVISKEIKGSEEGEEMKDVMQACWGPHPEHAGTEAFPERMAVSRGPDGGNPAESFQKAVQQLLGTQQGSSFQEGTGMFQRFNACLFGLKPHCVPGLPGATQQATRYKGPDGR